jgi:hypothetical protein
LRIIVVPAFDTVRSEERYTIPMMHWSSRLRGF